ncbi:MAG: hypothetical protein A2Z12_03635 [Actinobacteria bacterium RBG_16_68_21]|nr:MAG: hypothetical protein A2Z12_03635 [Actinobacteria bacterium RBG_16_68_21]
MDDPITAAARVFAGRSRLLIFTGAGISTESGIPDFRGPNGLWARIDPAEFTIDRYLASRKTRAASWRMRADSGTLDAQPNDGHRAVTALWRTGRTAGCITQNIDGLHQKAGLPPAAVVELHGNATQTECLSCRRRQPTAAIAARVAAGEADPPCRDCGGILKIRVVLFGELLPEDELDRAAEMTAVADGVIAIGSTLSVYPAAGIPLEVVGRGHPLVIINQGPTELDDLAEVIIDEPAGTALPRLVAALGVD